MGEVIPLRRPMTAVAVIRGARRALAAFLPPDSGISRPECLAGIARLFVLTPVAAGQDEAEAIIRRGREIIFSGGSVEEQLDQLFGLLESPEAMQFADPSLRELIHFD